MRVSVLKRSKVMTSERVFGRFNWPTVARLPDGRLLTVASGFRMGHVCPFGKVTGAYSEDEGETWSFPTVFIDTPLDDRDAGLAVGGKRVIITSFNNSRAFQASNHWEFEPQKEVFRDAYLPLISDEEEAAYIGSEYIYSEDGGKTFSEVRKAPVTSPHGPFFLPDGSLYYVGTACHAEKAEKGTNLVHTTGVFYATSTDGRRFSKAVRIPVPTEEGEELWEPHACLLPNGRILAAVRLQKNGDCVNLRTLYSYSDDGGKTYAAWKDMGSSGGPPHLCYIGGEKVLLTYGCRISPFSIRARLSTDNGENFGEELILCDDLSDIDCGYPATALCRDGALLTVYYGRTKKEDNTGVHAIRWRLEE